MTLWGNGQGQYCGAMRFETMVADMSSTTLTVNDNRAQGDGYPIDVGCGVLVGFSGKWVWRLDILCCLFLASHVRDVLVHDVEPVTSTVGRPGIQCNYT